mmetsp:Transcript_70094/g.102724  ORF Transcript_70094/g.102724 Transcript_70094/m.102724 type:complete len:87 (+) Transcript_70094:326-586(+)
MNRYACVCTHTRCLQWVSPPARWTSDENRLHHMHVCAYMKTYFLLEGQTYVHETTHMRVKKKMSDRRLTSLLAVPKYISYLLQLSK